MNSPPTPEDARSRALRLIEQGKQIGKSLTVQRGERSFYVRAAIQKREGKYEVLVDEIDEQLMDAEEYERDERRSFDKLEEAIDFIEGTTDFVLSDLAPSKGLKWFV